MGVGQVSVAAATAIVGYDLATGTIWQQQGKHRALTGFGFKGSAAALDTKIDLFVDTAKIAEFYNTGTGLPNNDDIISMDMNFIPAGSQIHIYITDAPITNPINVVVMWRDV